MAGRRPDANYARDLVQRALVDIWRRKVSWHPTSCCLRDRVISLVMERSFRDARWTENRPHLALADAAEIVAIQGRSWHGTRALLQSPPTTLEDLAREVVGKLRTLAENDDAVRRLLDAWADDLIERIEILSATGLSAAELKTARARPLYLLGDIAQHPSNRTTNLLRDAS